DGPVTIQARERLTVSNGRGRIVLNANGRIEIHGNNVLFNGQSGVTLSAPTVYKTIRHVPIQAAAAAPAITAPVARQLVAKPRSTLHSAHLSALNWSVPRAHGGDTVELGFTASGLTPGQAVTLTLFARHADGEEIVDRLTGSLQAGDGKNGFTWQLPPQAGDESIRLLRPGEEPRIAGLAEYVFEVQVGDHIARYSPRLTRLRALELDLQYHDFDSNSLPVPDTPIHWVIDGQNGQRSFQTALTENATTLTTSENGVLSWQTLGSATWGEVYQINDIQLTPGLDSPVVYTATPRTPDRLRLKAKALFPPVVLNLRPQAGRGEPPVLSPAQIAYFKENGNNATLFIHGFNVPLGEYNHRIVGVDVSRHKMPGGHKSGGRRYSLATARTSDQPATVYRELDLIKARFPDAFRKTNVRLSDNLDPDKGLNGTGALGWFLNMEYNLNRAAGFTGSEWDQYSRIIGVTWQGDVNPLAYMQAELWGTAAGRQLVPAIKQLHAEGIKINLIAHSLGNRVAMTALNLLGEQGHTDIIENAFLWQAAIPNTALSTDPALDTSFLGNWHLPHAHQAARRVIVLHSEDDNILGPQTGLGSMAGDVRRGEVGEALLGAWPIGSVYKRRLISIEALRDKLVEAYAGEPQHMGFHDGKKIDMTWPRLRRDMLREIRAKQNEPLPQYDKAAILGYVTRPTEWMVDELIERLRGNALAVAGRILDANPRPAMGYEGPDPNDPFVGNNRGTKFFVVPQTGILEAHSDMKIPSQELFDKIYRDVLMNVYIKLS
ncbi:MAG: alpha/beta hydrolase, partial [Pseudomonadota bacterium]|nr:alpha/beta hydrolase [Pseudomonadota bacterium]